MLFRASAPGSLMLLGEYAVLHGQHALVCAVDKRIAVTLTPRDDKKIKIESALGQHETTLVKLKIIPPFQFVLAAIKRLRQYLPTGCDLKIEAEFSATIGFASSAAVTVATLSALITWLNLTYSSIDLIKLARQVVRQVQGTGSGADVAACVMGGIVLYRMAPFYVEKFSDIYPITVVYSGSKTPTVEAIKKVQQNFAEAPKLFQSICQAINCCTLAGVDALHQRNEQRLGYIMTIQQGLMQSLGVNTETLDGIIKFLQQQPAIFGAKISGSGLGDCVVALGTALLAESEMKAIDVNMTSQGVHCEKI
jgi:mevalonate kinase